MANVEKISIALPGEMLETIRDAVAEGEYATTSEAIRDAVRNWEAERLWRRVVKVHGMGTLRATVRAATDSLDRGEGIPSEVVRAELTARYKAMAEKQKRKKTRT